MIASLHIPAYTRYMLRAEFSRSYIPGDLSPQTRSTSYEGVRSIVRFSNFRALLPVVIHFASTPAPTRGYLHYHYWLLQ